MVKKLSYLHTRRGILAAIWSEAGLYELTFPFASEEAARTKLTTRDWTESSLTSDQAAWQHTLESELKNYFQGIATCFSVPIDWCEYPDFRLKALQFTAEIPFGQVATYGGIAKALGSPGSARAVGGAMHANRTPIVVPCHRVVGSAGSLTGFGGGLPLKKELLELEQAIL